MVLHVVDGGQIVHSFEIPAGPVTIGRAPGNTLILQRPSVSSHHALLTPDGDGFRVRDLGSTNGIAINGARTAEGHFGSDDLLHVGGIELRLDCTTHAPVGALHVEQMEGPVSWVFESGLSLPGHEGTVLSRDHDGLWLDHEGDITPVRLDTPFAIAGRRYRIVARPLLTSTVPVLDHFPYRLETDLTDCRSRITAPSLAPVTVTSANRVALLYILTAPEQPWIDDATIGAAVWGRQWSRQDPNNLNVLLHRLRNEVARGGFDKRFIERRRGAMRLRVQTATTR